MAKKKAKKSSVAKPKVSEESLAQRLAIVKIVKLLNENNLTIKIEHQITVIPNTKK